MPPLVIDGIPTPVEKMTQAQLRAFIPLMLKYSTGRGKPGWGKESTKPPWWPEGVPWANVRMDARKNDDKQKKGAEKEIEISLHRVTMKPQLKTGKGKDGKDTYIEGQKSWSKFRSCGAGENCLILGNGEVVAKRTDEYREIKF